MAPVWKIGPVRNVGLHLQVPSIEEYWLLDSRDDPERPSLRVHRRFGGLWRVIDLGPARRYSTRLLPGVELIANPRS
jgi:hypothetical protein